jgi:hypothetical protein
VAVPDGAVVTDSPTADVPRGALTKTQVTRAGLEPATYGLRGRILIGVLALLSIVEACPGCCFASNA